MSLLAVSLLALAFQGDAAPNRMTPELLWKLGRVGAPAVSPDGKQLCFPVTRYDLEKNKGNADLWLLDIGSTEPRRLTTHEKSDSSPSWSPDGRRIGFLSARDGKTQVWAIAADGGEAERLTNVPEGVANFHWSPDGSHLSFTSQVKIDSTIADVYPDLKNADAKIIDDLLYRHWDSWSDGTYSHLMVQSTAPSTDAGKARDLMAGERVHTPLVPFGGAEEIAWSPDGKELCYTAKRVENPESSTDSDLYLVSVDGGESRCITDGMDGFDRVPSYSPDGKFIAFHSMERAGFEADRERLMLYDRSSGAIRELTHHFAHHVGEYVWAPDSGSLLFSSTVEGRAQLYRIDLAGEVTRLTGGRHNLTSIAVSPDGATLYALRSTTERPNEIVQIRAAGGEPEPLTDVNGAIYATLELPDVEERWITSKDGSRMLCLVVKPPDFDPNHKYPLLTYCQGGPQSPISQWFSYRWNFHLMAANGYVVVAPSRRGLPGFGQDWNDAISKRWGGEAMSDYFAATDMMFEEPWIDRARAAAVGASFGGYSVYWLMGHDQEDRFAAMVAHCGLFNLESWYGSTEELWFGNWDVAGGAYWEDSQKQALFDKNSPHRFVDQWDTPLLVIHGGKDFRVPESEAFQAFTAAKLRGVPTRFLYFPNEGHWVLSAQNGLLWHRVFFDWLDTYLAPPADSGS